MPEQRPSAFEAMRALRDELRARLDENEDYRAWKALDEALRQLEPRTLPKAVDLALSAIATPSGLADAELPRVDDAPLNFLNGTVPRGNGLIRVRTGNRNRPRLSGFPGKPSARQRRSRLCLACAPNARPSASGQPRAPRVAGPCRSRPQARCHPAPHVERPDRVPLRSGPRGRGRSGSRLTVTVV